MNCPSDPMFMPLGDVVRELNNSAKRWNLQVSVRTPSNKVMLCVSGSVLPVRDGQRGQRAFFGMETVSSDLALRTGLSNMRKAQSASRWRV